MTQNIHWILHTSIKERKLDDFKSVMTDMVNATKAEDGTLIYEWFINEDTMTCHISERFANNEAALVHLEGFGAYAERFMDALDINQMTIYGNPNDKIREAVKDMDPDYIKLSDGFIREQSFL